MHGDLDIPQQQPAVLSNSDVAAVFEAVERGRFAEGNLDGVGGRRLSQKLACAVGSGPLSGWSRASRGEAWLPGAGTSVCFRKVSGSTIKLLPEYTDCLWLRLFAS